ncbi:MAG: alpha-hydroxy-acid oxidizing protein [Gammaproteobacteria bacterium]|nr:alpha-hydroxy-acid oxidizing protein [Gammaproteobacteria bacterium]
MSASSEATSSGALARAIGVDDIRNLARRRLPKFIFDYLDGGADDEYTRRQNSRSFNALSLIQRVLVDVDSVDTSTTILGMQTSVPFVLSSTGASRFYHSEGEMAAARAAAKANVIYGTTSSAMYSLEDVASVGDAPRFFQVYVFKDRAVTKDYVMRCRSSGYDAMFLTVDCATAGNRERDIRNQLAIPPKITLRAIWHLLNAPGWSMDYLTSQAWSFPNVDGYVDESTKGDFNTAAEWFAGQLDRSFAWDDAEALCKDWGGQFVIKGITSVEDAKIAVSIGATGIVVSNHGGRQLDHAPTTLEVLPEIIDVVGDKVEVLVDSGYRRGTDVIKALALGAKGVLLGKAYLYGLGAGGEAGVSRVIEILKSELERNMMLMGLQSISQITSDCVRWRDPGFLR